MLESVWRLSSNERAMRGLEPLAQEERVTQALVREAAEEAWRQLDESHMQFVVSL